MGPGEAFGRRLAAYLVDVALFYGGLVAILFASGILWTGVSYEMAQQRFTAPYYFAWYFWWVFIIVANLGYGYSMGRWIMGIRLVDFYGRPATCWAMMLRNLCAGFLLPLTLGYDAIRMLFDRNQQTLHDSAAGTYVVCCRDPGFPRILLWKALASMLIVGLPVLGWMTLVRAVDSGLVGGAPSVSSPQGGAYLPNNSHSPAVDQRTGGGQQQ